MQRNVNYQTMAIKSDSRVEILHRFYNQWWRNCFEQSFHDLLLNWILVADCQIITLSILQPGIWKNIAMHFVVSLRKTKMSILLLDLFQTTGTRQKWVGNFTVCHKINFNNNQNLLQKLVFQEWFTSEIEKNPS